MHQRPTRPVSPFTGSTSNIGRATALRFAAEGARVVVMGRDAQRGAEAVNTIRTSGGEATFIIAELDGSTAGWSA